MQLVFIYGQPASGKLTVGRALAERTGFAVFHNHLIVDAVGAVFPFGSPEFVRLRESMWLDVMRAAARTGRSLIFTFAPEATVAVDFPQRVRAEIEALGGRVIFVALVLPETEQERRIDTPDRSRFDKMRSLEMLHQYRDVFVSSMARMPEPAITIDTATRTPDEAAAEIVGALTTD
ncbi:shikimate kinase [Nordella sp. HKS 07]|uniref:AAA family ATPase n=1 Tax=Nordella sp. HKS 07 TaxID=2712222 RepID=UPI0013E1DFD6|nr:shikimate kinase [Nordella sp. HKS 07]QIG51318.1 shikimate kinase [Nordella sp. HKS 07]